jgi:hypothetical protein
VLDALHPVAPGARDLDRRLDGLGAGVHRQHHVFAAQLREPLEERAEHVVVEGAAGQRDAIELSLRGIHQHRMPVAEVDRRVRGQAVEVALAVDVGDPGAEALGDHDIERVVVVRAELADLGEVAGRLRRDRGRTHRRSSKVQHLTPPPPSSSSLRSTPWG